MADAQMWDNTSIDPVIPVSHRGLAGDNPQPYCYQEDSTNRKVCNPTLLPKKGEDSLVNVDGACPTTVAPLALRNENWVPGPPPLLCPEV